MTHTKTQDRPFYIAWIFSAMVIALLFFAGCSMTDANQSTPGSTYSGVPSGCSGQDPEGILIYDCEKNDDGTVDPNIRKILPPE